MERVYAPPSIYVVSRNETSTFYCDAVGPVVFWGINGTTVDDDGETEWENKGYVFHKRVTHDMSGNRQNIHHNSLVVPALLEHNNTVISCSTIGDNSRQKPSDSVKIIVMGKWRVQSIIGY